MLPRCYLKKISLVFASILLASAPASAQTLGTLTVLADQEVSVAISKLARDYARQEGVSVSTSFVEKTQQALQINEGAAADILITQDESWIEDLRMQGLVDVYSKMEFARGRLALVGPEDSPLVLTLGDNFMSAPLVHAMNYEPALYVGNPEYVSDGKYAREALRNLGMLYVLEPYTLYLKSNDEIVEQVTRHGAYAVMPYGQALLMEQARVVDVFPETSHSPIIYYAVVLAGDNMKQGREFMKYLASASARNIILRSGLLGGVRS